MKVEVEPSGVSFEIQPDESIIQAAWRGGYWWPTTCEGQGTCKVCVALVLEGEVSPIEEREAQGLQVIAHSLPDKGGEWRLACQAKAKGDIRVRQVGVKPA